MLAAVWGSPLVVDGKVYLGDEDGDVVVLQAGKEKKVLAEMNMGSAVYATPVPAHGALFLNNRNQLFALARCEKSSGRAAAASHEDHEIAQIREPFASGFVSSRSRALVGSQPSASRSSRHRAGRSSAATPR